MILLVPERAGKQPDRHSIWIYPALLIITVGSSGMTVNSLRDSAGAGHTKTRAEQPQSNAEPVYLLELLECFCIPTHARS